ncbi:hypothetical protein Tco_0645852 [Tanacetum coccineum]
MKKQSESKKALDEGFSSKNYFRKFLRAQHPKWRAKVTAIKESKDLSSLALDELIGNLKIHKVVMEKDSKIYKGKKEKVKSITLKAKKESSDDETSTSRSDDEEYAMAVRNFKNFFRRKGKQPREEKKPFRKRNEKKGKSDRKCFRCSDPNHLIGDCLKPSRNKDQKAFIRGLATQQSLKELFDLIKPGPCQPRPEPTRAATLPLPVAYPRIRRRGERKVGFEGAQSRGESRVERNTEGGRPLEETPRGNGCQILGLHKEQRTSGFVHGLRTRSLIEHLSTNLPSTYKGLMEKTYTWVEAREVATNGIKKERTKSSDTPRGESKKDKGTAPAEAPILMVSREAHIAKILAQENTNYGGKEIIFPLVEKVNNVPVIIEAKIFGRKVGRVYMDSESSCKIIYEHCFEKLNPTIKATKVDLKTLLVGFSGERSWSIGEVPLEITIGDAPSQGQKLLTSLL